jgi:hypothetical protein
MKARQERANAEMKALQAKIKAACADMEARAVAHRERFFASPDGLTFYGEGKTTCQTETTSCPGEMDATRLESTLEETEAAVERQKLGENEINVDNIASLEA